MLATDGLHRTLVARSLEPRATPEREADITETSLFSFQFFQKYLTPEERADLMMVSVEAMSRDSRHDVCAASELLRMILKCSVPEIGKVGTSLFRVSLRILPFCSVLDFVLFHFLLVGV